MQYRLFKDHIRLSQLGFGAMRLLVLDGRAGEIDEAFMYGDTEAARKKYRTNVADAFKADQCGDCGQCEAHCPQHLSIRQTLKDAHIFLTSNKEAQV